MALLKVLTRPRKRKIGSLSIAHFPTASVVQNNMFDETVIYDDGSYTGGFNGYVTNFNQLSVSYGTDVVLSNSVYQSSWLGNYYIPTNSALTNVGSTTADQLGLYQYTTHTNQVKQSNNLVDIGYHYVAVDSSGNPIDTDGSGVADYLKDANGNGLVDSGEINWTNAADIGLTVIITRPSNNSPIP